MRLDIQSSPQTYLLVFPTAPLTCFCSPHTFSWPVRLRTVTGAGRTQGEHRRAVSTRASPTGPRGAVTRP